MTQDETMPRFGRSLMVASIVGLGTIAFLAANWSAIGKEYRNFFYGFGTDLSAMTSFVVVRTTATALILGCVALAHSFVLVAYFRSRTQGLRTTAKLFVWIDFVVVGVLAGVVYAPIWELGAVV